MTKTDCTYKMPEENPDSHRLDFEMERVKSFLSVKSQTELISGMESLERISGNLIKQFIRKAQEVEHQKRTETTLEGVIHSLKVTIGEKIARMEEENSKIQIIL